MTNKLKSFKLLPQFTGKSFNLSDSQLFNEPKKQNAKLLFLLWKMRTFILNFVLSSKKTSLRTSFLHGKHKVSQQTCASLKIFSIVKSISICSQYLILIFQNLSMTLKYLQMLNLQNQTVKDLSVFIPLLTGTAG